jgi:hypothetical protein
VSKLLTDYVRQPDHSELIDEIAVHTFLELKRFSPIVPGMHVGAKLVKIITCTPTHLIYEEYPQKIGTIDLGEWSNNFGQWVENDNAYWLECFPMFTCTKV